MVNDLCHSTFLQSSALLLVFLGVLLWIIGQKRGQLPLHEGLARLSSTSSSFTTTKAAFVQTPESRAMLDKLRDAVVQLDRKRLSHLEFHESDDTRIDNKQVVYLCLRDPATGQMYPWNALIYVTLHEMAHAISDGYDPMHTSQEFQSNFWQLLRKAERAGIYKPGEAFVNEYCALPIDKTDPGVIIR